MAERSFRATVPSNIAFIKYWGKRCARTQQPANSSLSMTLSGWQSRCQARRYSEISGDHRFFFGGQEFRGQEPFSQKVFQQLQRITEETGFHGSLELKSENTFPTGCGVASSASGLGALTLAAVAACLDLDSFEALQEAGWSRERLAGLARLGSGSACRSFWGGFVLWEAEDRQDGRNVRPLYPVDWWPLTDTLIIFSEAEKAISSSEAHKAAWSSPLFAPRIAGIPEKMAMLRQALQDRNIAQLGPLLEQEALEMHSVMMTARPPACYLSQEATEFLAAFRRYRQKSGIPLWFTIDAGPNIHLIGEASAHQQLDIYLREEYPHLKSMRDSLGSGPDLSSD